MRFGPLWKKCGFGPRHFDPMVADIRILSFTPRYDTWIPQGVNMKAKAKPAEFHKEKSTTRQPYDFLQAPKNPDLQELIRQRAYELSQQRNGDGGDEVRDWYRAEAEIRAAFDSSEFNELTENEGRKTARKVSAPALNHT
jgi:hypothetical protein